MSEPVNTWRELADREARARIVENGTLERQDLSIRYEFGEEAKRQSQARLRTDSLRIEWEREKGCREVWDE